MAGNARDEIINYTYNVTGNADLAKASGSLYDLASATEKASPEAKALVEQLQQLAAQDKLISSFISTKAALADVQNQLGEATRGADELTAAYDRSDRSSAKINAAFALSDKTIASLTDKQSALSLEFQKASGGLEKAGIDAGNLSAAHTVLADSAGVVTQKLSTMAASGALSGSALEKVAGSAEKAGESATIGAKALEYLHDHLLEIVSVAAAAELALKAIEFGADTFKEGLAAAEEVQASLSRVQASAQGTADQFKELPEVVEKAASAVNVSTEQAAAGVAALAGRGLDLGKSFEALIPTLQLAKIANIDVATSAATVATTLQAFNLPASEAQRVVDILATASHGAAGGLEAISKAAATLAPDAQKLGLSLTDTVAILEALNQKGIDSEKAVRALRTVFQDLQSPASDLRTSLRGLGDNTSSFTTAVQALNSHTPAAEEALRGLTGESRAVVEALGQAGPEALAKFQAALDSSGGSAQTLAQKLDDNVKGALTRFNNAFGVAAENLAKPVLKPLQDELELLAAKLTTLSDSPAFEKISEEIGQFASKAFTALNNFISGIDWDKFGDNAVAALSGAVEKADQLAKSAATIAAAVNKVSDGVAAAYHGAAANIDALQGTTAAATGAVEAYVGNVVQQLGDANETLASTGAAITNLGKQSLQTAKTDFVAAGDQTKAFVDDLKDIVGVAPKASAAIEDLGHRAGDAGKSLEDSEREAEKLSEHLDELIQFQVAGTLAGQRLGAQILDTGKDFGTASDNFQLATKTLADLKTKADEAAQSAKVGLTQQLQNLGLSAEQAGVKFTAAGQKIITSFTDISTNAQASGAQIQLAFAKALSQAQTEGEVEALEAALRGAFAAGKISADQFTVATQAAGRKIADLQVAAAESGAALDGMGKSGQTAAQTISTSLQATRDKAVQQANDIAIALANAIKAGADPALINDLKAQYAKADAVLAGLNTRISALTPNLGKLGGATAQATAQVIDADSPYQKFSDALNVLGDSSASLADKQKALGIAQQNATTSTDEQTVASEKNSLAGGAASLVFQQLVSAINSARAAFQAISPAATSAFDGALEGALKLQGIMPEIGSAAKTAQGALEDLRVAAQSDVVGIDRYYFALAQAQAEVTDKINEQKTALDTEITSLKNVGVVGTGSLNDIEQSATNTLSQLQALDGSIKSGASNFKLLSDTDLSALDTAIQSAITRTQALRGEALAAQEAYKSLSDQIADSLDQANGNDAAVEDRRYKQQLADLQAAADKAKELGSAQYQQDVANAEALHALNLKNIQAQADAQKAADKASGSSTSSGSSSSGSSTGSTPLPSGSTNQPTSTTTITNLQPAPVVNLYASLYGVGNKEMDTLVRYLNDQIIKIQNRSK